MQYFGEDNPLAVPALDPGGDGQDNSFEYTAGLILNDAASRFTTTIAPVAGQPTQMNVVFDPIVADRSYMVKSKAALADGAWAPLTSSDSDKNGVDLADVRYTRSLLAFSCVERLYQISAVFFTPHIMEVDHPRAHRRSCLRIVLSLLFVWFSVSYGCAIIFREWLDAHAPQIGNAPFGFWMAQQGAIICFVLLLVVYAVLMNRLDAKHGYSENK